MTLRRAHRGDIQAMHHVRVSVRENRLSDSSLITDEMYREHLEELGCGWVYEVGGRIVGFAVGNQRDCSVWALFVDPGFEGRGIGRALHDEMLRSFGAAGAAEVTLTTEADSRAARFYVAAGWESRGYTSDGQAIFAHGLQNFTSFSRGP